MALAVFNAIVILANWVIWGEGPLSESVRINVVLAIVPFAAFFGTRRVQAVGALAYLLVAIWGLVQLLPEAY